METVVETPRLRLYPASRAQMEALIAAETDEGLRAAYGQMLEESLRHPEQRVWYAAWLIEDREGARVGDLCFKGLDEKGVAEIGYGLLEERRGRGYASEAVRAALTWAFAQPGVRAIEAEAEEGNLASRRVLEKCGFYPNGRIGEEGPRYTCLPPDTGRCE